MNDFSSDDRTFLRQYLAEKFNLSELKTLAFDLGVDYEMFPHGTKPDLSRELIAYFERKDRLHSLIQGIIQVRPDNRLSLLLARFPEKDGIQKVQIILSNDQIKGKPDLQQKLAELLGISAGDVMVIATAAGSVKVLLGLPPEAAARLAALELPYQLAEYEIISVSFFASLPRPARDGWRSLFQATAGTADVVIKGAGMGLLGKILLWLLGGVLVLLLIGGGATAVWWQGLPRMTIVNQCDRTLPIPVPDIGRNLLDLPRELPRGQSLDFPLLSGRGIYRLIAVEQGRQSTIVLLLPRPLPLVNTDRLDFGPMDETVRFNYNGTIVQVPTEFVVSRGQRGQLVLCAEGTR